MNTKIVIAIDGYSSTGKSTLAKQLASRLGYIYVDTGAMYRAVTLYAFQHQLISPTHFDKAGLIAHLDLINLRFVFNDTLGFAEMYLNQKNVEQEIRGLAISQLVSQVAAVSEVRSKLVAEQQAMGKDKGIVMDGRDIGTVVFPEAELKLFLTASAATRAERRFTELSAKGDSVTYDEIYANLIERDHIDSTREDSPLVKADDAIEIDNSNLTLEAQFDYIMQLIENLA